MATKLEPADHSRCQAEITTYRPFVMGGPTSQTKRCDNQPVFIATENQPGDDGQRGEMSLCLPCSEEAHKHMPAGFAHFEPIIRKAS